MVKDKNSLYAPIMVVLLIVASFFIGRLSAKLDAAKTVEIQPTVAQPQQAGDTPAKASLADIKALFGKDVIKFGDANRKVLFVEVSDPSCPYCHIAAGLNSKLNNDDPRFKLVADGGTYVAPGVEMKKLLDQNKASFVWLYQNGHGNGELAAKALYCANDKGKFWQAHEKLFTAEGYSLINEVVKNDKTKAGTLAAFLKSAVDSKYLTECLSGTKYDERLASDQKIAESIGVSGTPGFYVNATFFGGAVNYSTQMDALVKEALK